jgi:hypothetical protein
MFPALGLIDYKKDKTVSSLPRRVLEFLRNLGNASLG